MGKNILLKIIFTPIRITFGAVSDRFKAVFAFFKKMLGFVFYRLTKYITFDIITP